MSDRAFRRTVFTIIIAAGVLLYANTLNHAQFIYDGNLFLLNNPLMKDLKYYSRLLNIYEFSTLDEQLGLNIDVATNFMMRPVAYLTFSLNYLASGFNPASFRSVNIAIHIVNSILVFTTISQLLKLAPESNAPGLFSARFIPAATAFLFLLHPLQTESVTYITQRFASLAALFYLATIRLYLAWIRQQIRGYNNRFLRWLSVIVMILGMLTRESLVSAPLMLVLLEVSLLGSSLKCGLKRAAAHLAFLPLVPLMVVIVSAGQNDAAPTLSGAINIVNYVNTEVNHYALTQLVVVAAYMRLLLLPYGQNIDHDQQLYTLPYQWPVACSALLHLLIISGTFILQHKNREDVRYKLIFAGVCWYYLALSASSSFIPQPDLIAEHRTYLASTGFIMALICLLDLIRSRTGTVQAGRILIAATTVWCLTLTVLTYNRNLIWQSGIKLWSDAARKSPDMHRPLYNLAIAYTRAGNHREGVKYLQKSIDMSPEWGQAYEVLALSYLELKRYQDAIATSLRGISVDPANPVHYNNLGIAYAETAREEDARQAFSTAIALMPGYTNALVNLDRIETFMESSAGKRK